MKPREVHFDWQHFAQHVERLRVEHANRSAGEGVAATLAAFDRWGVTPPPAFIAQHPAAAATRHRDSNAVARSLPT